MLKRTETLSKKELDQVARTIATRRAAGACEAAWQAILAMTEIPFRRWCEYLRPLFALSREQAFLGAEGERLLARRRKGLEGVLRKKIGYKRMVRGMTERKLKDETIRRHASRIAAFEERLEQMDIRRVLLRALTEETDTRRKRAMKTLLDLFSDEAKERWGGLVAGV